MINILLVDDHQMIRQGLRLLLSEQPDMTVVGEAKNGREALEMVVSKSPSVVVMDLNMPELNGIDATRQVVAARKGIKVICLSAHANQKMAADALSAGAEGYVLKESAFEELVTAIRTVMGNKVYLSPSIAGMVVGDLLRLKEGFPAGPSNGLSSREREILQLISEGRTTKQIAYGLHISVKTVETHRRNMMEKLNIDNVAELTKYAVREGLTSL